MYLHMMDDGRRAKESVSLTGSLRELHHIPCDTNLTCASNLSRVEPFDAQLRHFGRRLQENAISPNKQAAVPTKSGKVDRCVDYGCFALYGTRSAACGMVPALSWLRDGRPACPVLHLICVMHLMCGSVMVVIVGLVDRKLRTVGCM